MNVFTLSLPKLTFLGMSAVSFVLIFIVSVSCLFHTKVHLYGNENEAINMNSTGEIIAKSVISPTTCLKHRGRLGRSREDEAVIKSATPIFPKQHVSKVVQTVNLQLINTVSNPGDVIPDVPAESKGIYFSIKTTQKNHSTRLSILLLTWMQTVLPAQVHIITDVIKPAEGDEWVRVAKKQGISVLSTGCLPDHNPWSLCCKSGHEFDSYYKARRLGNQYKWFCHFDDDVYVNVPMLATALRTFHPLKDSIYIGRWPDKGGWSTVHKPTVSRLFPHYHRINFRFAVGAGYCISHALMSQLENYLRGGLFRTYCSEFKMVDNMLVGVIIESVLGYTLVHNSRFNSHYNFQNYSLVELKEQITISYMLGQRQNTITLPNGAFSEQKDPTRLFSLHCHLHAQIESCKRHSSPSSFHVQ